MPTRARADESPDATRSGEDQPDGTTAADAAVSQDGKTVADVKDASPDNVASPQENAALTHSDETEGTTTRSDATDAGVPMLPGSPDEPVGPEDALGDGLKRGNYTGRIGPSGYEPMQTQRIPDAKDGEPHTRLVAQRPKAEDIGDVKGRKGGVDSDEDDRPGRSRRR